jgi:hypothetical protein
MVTILHPVILSAIVALGVSSAVIGVYEYLTPSAIETPRLLITKRIADSTTIPPGGLRTSNVQCNADEIITGGGYVSSSSGVRVKDADPITAGGDDDVLIDVTLEGGEMWHVNGFNDHADQSVTFRALVFCGKLVE